MVTLTNITGYVETSRTISEQTAGLDTIQSVFTGPTAQLQSFLPLPGAVHPSFPLMQLWQLSVREEAGGLVSAVSITYKGRLTTNGKSKFISESVLNEQWIEKEFNYQTQNVTGGPQTTPTTWFVESFASGQASSQGTTIYLTSNYPYRVLTSNWAIRYLTNNVKYRYCCNFDPKGSPQFQTQGFGKCGVEFQYQTLMSSSATDVTNYQDLPTVPNKALLVQLVSFNVNQFNTWYECEEVYEERWVAI